MKRNQIIFKLFKAYTVASVSFLFAYVFASVFTPVEASGAIACIDGSTGTSGQVCDTASSDISVTVENPWYISVASSAGSGSGIALDYTAESGNKLGTVVTATDTVKTTSNTGQIKHLYISTSSSSNNLTNDDTDLENNKTYIGAGGGDTLAGATSLNDNTWGFNIENNNNFTKVPTLGNDIVIQEEIGTENAETGEYESTQNVYFGALATSALNAGKYSNTVLYTAFTTEPPEEETRTIQDITYMHEMSGDICNNTDEGVTTKLKDIRGSYTDPNTPAEYGVIKAKDGNCWMTDNLNLYGRTGANAITAEYSDFESGTYEIPVSSNWSGNIYDVPKVHRAINSGYTSQVYYNWTAAVALTNGSTAEQQDQSICPKNWQLPIDGDASTNKSYAMLIDKYNIATGPEVVANSALGFAYFGNWNSSYPMEFGQGANGYFWSSTPMSSTNAQNLSYYSSGTLNSRHSRSKGTYAISIRCVSRD